MNATNSQQFARGFGRGRTTVVALGAAIAGIVVIAAIALGGRGNGGGNAVGVPLPGTSPSAAPIVTPVPSAAPATPVPTAEPTEVPQDTPNDIPPDEPTDGGSDAMPLTVNLENATGADIRVDIVDRTGFLVDAASGTPGDGVSVATYTLKVENVDAKTLKLTWSDYPIDNALALYIDEIPGGYRFLLVQPDPTTTTDAIAFDRELVLTFSGPISASQVEAFLQSGLDTPG
jgi:hypothetical protein